MHKIYSNLKNIKTYSFNGSNCLDECLWIWRQDSGVSPDCCKNYNFGNGFGSGDFAIFEDNGNGWGIGIECNNSTFCTIYIVLEESNDKL